MRRFISGFVVFGVLLGVALVSQAGDEATAIIDKAIAAHGIKGKNDKGSGYRGKNKGTLHVSGLNLDFTQEVSVQVPNKFKEVMEMTVMGNKVLVTSAFDGKQGWLKVNDMDMKVENELLDEFKEAAYAIGLAQSLFVKDKTFKFDLLGEAQVNGKPSVGIRVSKEGQKDISFYFDKATGLMSKIERRTRDFTTKQEVTDERIITEYQEVAGRKIARKVEVVRDGKAFLEAEVLEATFHENLDDSEFAKP